MLYQRTKYQVLALNLVIVTIYIGCIINYDLLVQSADNEKEILDSMTVQERHGLTKGDIVVDVSCNPTSVTVNMTTVLMLFAMCYCTL